MTENISREALLSEIARLKQELQEARLSEELLTTLTDTSFEGIGLFDEELRCIENNKMAQILFGYSQDEIKGIHALSVIAPESHSLVKENLQQKKTTPYEAIAIKKNGETFPALIQGADINFRGKTLRATAVRDITEIHQKKLELQLAHSELELIFENSMVGMLLLRGGRTVHRANQRIADILGYENAAELIGKHTSEFYPSQQAFEEFGEQFFKALNERDLSQIDYQFRRKDGSTVWCTMCGKAVDTNNPPDLTKGVLWVADDITVRKDAEKLLIKLATTDELTGLWNRRHFLDVGDKELARKKRYSSYDLSLLMLDIDFFKRINDNFGHDVGDKALKAFAELTQSCLREVDIQGRLGGEEFAILLPNTDQAQALLLANRICKTIKNQAHKAMPDIPPMTVSIGISSAQQGDDTLGDLLKRADNALYKAKKTGRDRAEVYLT